MRAATLAIALVAVAAPAFAQAPAPAGPPPTLLSAAKAQFDQIRGNIVKAAEKMAEADYAFKPTPEVRSFGALLGHVADANFMLCSRVAGEKSPMADSVEKTKTSKADLVKAVSDSFAYCEGVHGKITDANATEAIDWFRGKQPRLAAFNMNTMHNWEHYGNLVTYMRMKGLVPPSSEGR
jgi:uncharacterized damage-inducible protein DinB